MAAHTENPIAISYATFLVHVCPDDAVDILCQIDSGDSGDNVTLVEKRVNFICAKLRGPSKNRIKVMLEDQDWDGLRAMLPSTGQVQLTPRGYNPMEVMPPTPSTTASGSSRSHRRRSPGPDLITIYHEGKSCTLTATPSGSEQYMIGDDKLERFLGATVEQSEIPHSFDVGGRRFQVDERVRLTWSNHGNRATKYDWFWVVDSEHIRHADVLLGYKSKASRGRRDQAVVQSPFALDPQDSRNRMPAAPTAPPAVQSDFYQQQHSSTAKSAIYTGSPFQGYGQAAGQSDSGPTIHQAPRTSTRTVSSASGSRGSQAAMPSMAPSSMERPAPRPHSVSSTKPAKPLSVDTVMIQLSFEGKGARLLPLDLSKAGDEIIPWLEPHVLKMSGGRPIDRNNHELKVIPFHGNGEDAPSTPLSEDYFDHTWETIKEFIRDNRAGSETKKV